ncbi:MAG: 4a-hydroxytetrahydrobiopterin dehydratase [Geodermatophilaceae bacterium]|nr:4a-hydroxytetrahydrobiopterin dehydratase [Geodermatophilaceae bacterium]
MRTLLTQEELDRALEELRSWRSYRGAIRTRIQAPDFPAAIALVSRIAEMAEEMDHHPDIDIRWRNIDVALATHSAGGITEMDVTQARRIGDLAAQAGAQIAASAPHGDGIEIGIDCMDAAAIQDFWRVGLGLTERTGTDGTIDLVGTEEDSPGVWFQQMTEPRTQRNRIHVDVYVRQQQAEERVAAVIAAGGHLVTDRHAPSWWVLADAEGNELCVCV